jgi:hypothetical protein
VVACFVSNLTNLALCNIANTLSNQPIRFKIVPTEKPNNPMACVKGDFTKSPRSRQKSKGIVFMSVVYSMMGSTQRDVNFCCNLVV